MTRKWILPATAAALVAACVGDNPTPGDDGPLTDGGSNVGDDGAPSASSSSSSSGSSGTLDAATDAPSVTCPSGQSACGEQCFDLKTSSANCGACGFDCGGTTCADSVCAPATLASNLATAPYGVTAAANRAFWVRDGAVESAGVDGNVTPISDQVTLPGGALTGTTIVTDGNKVAWLSSATGGNAIFSASTVGIGSQSPTAAHYNSSLVQLAMLDTTIYAAGSYAGNVAHCPISGCTDDTIEGIAGTSVDPGAGLAVTATDLFFTAGTSPTYGGLYRCALADCPNDRARLFADAKLVAVAGGTVFASTVNDAVVSCDAKAGCGGSPQPIASNQPGITALIASDTYLYYALSGAAGEATGEIRACQLPDCAGGPQSLVTGQAQPVSLAYVDGFLYWANAGLTGQVATTTAIRRIRH